MLGMATYNGATVNGYQIVKSSPEERAYMKARALALKERARAIVNTKPENDNYLFGSRFNDADHIGYRAFSWIPGEIEINDNNREVIDNYIIAAYIDGASADYYYLCEKNWG